MRLPGVKRAAMKGLRSMTYYLIDYENTGENGLRGIPELHEDDCIVIFYSENADKISFDMHQKLIESKAVIEYRKISTGKRNALDFQLSTYLGYLIARCDKDSFYIVSKDNGYRVVVDFWKDYDVQQIERIAMAISRPERKMQNAPAAAAFTAEKETHVPAASGQGKKEEPAPTVSVQEKKEEAAPVALGQEKKEEAAPAVFGQEKEKEKPESEIFVKETEEPESAVSGLEKKELASVVLVQEKEEVAPTFHAVELEMMPDPAESPEPETVLNFAVNPEFMQEPVSEETTVQEEALQPEPVPEEAARPEKKKRGERKRKSSAHSAKKAEVSGKAEASEPSEKTESSGEAEASGKTESAEKTEPAEAPGKTEASGKSEAPGKAPLSEKELREQVAQVISGEEEQENICRFITRYKTKQGVNNAIMKLYGSEKAGELYKKIKPLIKDKKGK